MIKIIGNSQYQGQEQHLPIDIAAVKAYVEGQNFTFAKIKPHEEAGSIFGRKIEKAKQN